MKKIININLSGRVIPIEDSAYEKLQSYIESLRRYFANEEGRDEIINDIESRIAELMSDKVRKGANAITDADIDEIVASMGRPEDFDAETIDTTSGSGQQNTQQEYSRSESRRAKRLYRDSSDKFVGGVCSGIAIYLNTDPAIVRILFAIITFGGFGLGFLIYIALWIFLPEADLESEYVGKRLYRNPDDKVIGGVAGGLAAYFNSRASTIRLIFSAPILISILVSVINRMTWHSEFGHFVPNIVFGSLSGTFIVTYVILWMVLPEARSTYEKMEMRGEKVDVNTIRQNVQEGMGNVKDRMKQWGEEVKQTAQNFGTKAKAFADSQGKTFAREVNQTARSSGRGLAHAIGVLFKVFFLFIAGTIAFALFVAVMAMIFGGIAWWPINDFLWTSKWQQAYAWGTLLFFLLVPLVGFIIWIIRRIIGARSRRSYLGWTFGFLWTIGWVCAILLTASIFRDFREYDNSGDISIPISQPTNGRMLVVVSKPELQYNGNFSFVDDDWTGWDVSGDTGRLSTVKFNFKKSDDSSYHVILRKYSYGSSHDDAIRRASKIQYAINSKDSVLDLGNGYTVDKESKFRLQQVEIEVQIPVGKKIRFDQTVDKLNPSDLKWRSSTTHRRTRINGRIVNEYYRDEDYFRFNTDVDYTMTADNKLTDPSGRTIYPGNDYRNNNNYRYDNRSETDTLSIQQQLEQKKREIKELEKKQKESRKSTGEQGNRKEDETVAKTSIPVFSTVGSLL